MVSRLALVLVWIVLMGLLGASVLLSRLSAGAVASASILAVAAMMVGLIGWFFMHLRTTPGMVRLLVLGLPLWLLLLFGTLVDWLTR